MLNFCDFIQVFVFTRNHHLKYVSLVIPAIGVGRFWTGEGGGERFRIFRGGGGGKGRGKLFAGCKLIGAPAHNQCQIITFLTLKTDNTAKLKIELKSILLEIPSTKIKGTYIKLVHLWSSFTISHRHWRKMLMDYCGGAGGPGPLFLRLSPSVDAVLCIGREYWSLVEQKVKVVICGKYKNLNKITKI